MTVLVRVYSSAAAATEPVISGTPDARATTETGKHAVAEVRGTPAVGLAWNFGVAE